MRPANVHQRSKPYPPYRTHSSCPRRRRALTSTLARNYRASTSSLSTMRLSRGSRGVGGGPSGGSSSRGGSISRGGPVSLSEEERKNLVRSAAAKMCAARKWTNWGIAPPPPLLRPYMPATGRRVPPPRDAELAPLCSRTSESTRRRRRISRSLGQPPTTWSGGPSSCICTSRGDGRGRAVAPIEGEARCRRHQPHRHVIRRHRHRLQHPLSL
jgi:hypothetical protein